MPGMLMSVAFDRFAATDAAKSNEVTASKLPEMSSVGMLLTSGRRRRRGGRDFPNSGTVIVEVRKGADCLMLNRGRIVRKSPTTGFDDVLICGELLAAGNPVPQSGARGGDARRRRRRQLYPVHGDGRQRLGVAMSELVEQGGHAR